jgi:hypothetical protein
VESLEERLAEEAQKLPVLDATAVLVRLRQAASDQPVVAAWGRPA